MMRLQKEAFGASLRQSPITTLLKQGTCWASSTLRDKADCRNLSLYMTLRRLP